MVMRTSIVYVANEDEASATDGGANVRAAGARAEAAAPLHSRSGGRHGGTCRGEPPPPTLEMGLTVRCEGQQTGRRTSRRCELQADSPAVATRRRCFLLARQ